MCFWVRVLSLVVSFWSPWLAALESRAVPCLSLWKGPGAPPAQEVSRVHTEGSKPRMLDEQVCRDGGVVQSG